MDELSKLAIAGRIVRNSKDEVIVKTGNYWNTDVVDIRWHTEDKPTRKGIRLNLEEAKLLLTILQRELNG